MSRRPDIQHFSVVVVGGGPTGLTLANLLGVYGIDCLLLERNEATVQEPRAVSIDDESLRTMQAVGLIDAIRPRLAIDYGSHYLTPSGRCFARIEPTTREFGHPRRNAFIQPELQQILRTGLHRFENVQARFGHEVTNVTQSNKEVAVTIVHSGDQSYVVTGDYLVASDGGRSDIRTSIGASLEGSTYEQKWLIVDLDGTKDPFRQTRVYCDAARPGISLPGPRKTRRFEFMLHPHEREEDMVNIDVVKKLLRDHGPDENAIIVRKQVYTFHARRADKWRVGRIFLAGDAAHLTPPFAGQGMNSGLRDSFNIAWKLAAVVRGVANQNLLDSYQTERSPHAWQLIEMALLLGRIMMPSSRFKQWLTQTSFRLLGLCQPAKRYISEMRYKPKPRFENGFFIADKHRNNQTWVGRMFPQPELEDGRGLSIYMDEILGNGMVLIAFHADPHSVLRKYDQPLWDDVGVRKIGITPRNYNPMQSNIFRDKHGEMAQAMKNYRDTVILLRPDRYVAATMSNTPSASQLDAAKRLLVGP